MGPFNIADPGLPQAAIAGVASGPHQDVLSTLVSSPVLLFGAVVILALLAMASSHFSGRNRKSNAQEPDRYEMHSDVGFGAQCPNCRSYATQPRQGSFEKRECGMCGHAFELRS